MNERELIKKTIASSEKAKSLLLAKYSASWVGNEENIRFCEMTAEDESCYMAISKSLNEQRGLLKNFELSSNR